MRMYFLSIALLCGISTVCKINIFYISIKKNNLINEFAYKKLNSLNFSGKVTYTRTTTLPGDMQYNGKTTLFFNPERSLFVHNDAPTNDISVNYKELGMTGSVFGDSTGFPILKLHAEKKIWFKSYFPFSSSADIAIIRDTFATSVWTIDAAKTRTIGGFLCEKATGHYRGRDYEVWYAPDIPIPSGPFKLGGLPGLIMEARSTDGNVQFLFSGIEFPLNETVKIEMPPGGYEETKNYAEIWTFVRERCKKMEKDAAAQGYVITVGPPFETIELNTN